MSFTQFGLSAALQRALADLGYLQPTPIQTDAIPHVMAGRDLLGIAQTGTGKTAAFALPMLHRLSEQGRPPGRRRCRALILSPTRELASQIAENAQLYARHLRLTTTVVFGGVAIGRQERAIAQGVDILVATPGRLLDLVDRRSLDLGGVEILVLDEADQMLDLGFIHALRRVASLVPAERQTLLFSATMPDPIAALASRFLRDPVRVAVAPVATTAERVEQSVVFASTGDKQALLRAVLDDRAVERALVFTRTKHGADRVVRNLDRQGVRAAAIHGNKSQSQRERALADFKAGRMPVLVATDIAARGIDIDAVSHVINFDLPNVPEQYVHRIGRTARAGAAGVAISFCNDEERAYLRDIEKLTRQRVPVAEPPAGFVRGAAPSRSEAPAHEARRQPGHRDREPSRAGGVPGRRDGHPAGRRDGGAQNAGKPRGGANAGRDRRPAPAQPRAAKPAQPRPAKANPPRRSGPTDANGRDGSSLAWLAAARRSPDR